VCSWVNRHFPFPHEGALPETGVFVDTVNEIPRRDLTLLSILKIVVNDIQLLNTGVY
jgi:hypothetical protein